MSLVGSYVHCADEKWYLGLIYRDETDMWFVCFDDDDPIELVIRRGCRLSPAEILDSIGFPWTSYSSVEKCGMRIFEREQTGKQDKTKIDLGQFRPAVRCWVWTGAQTHRFPTPTKHCRWDEVYDERPETQGVFYGGL